MPSSAPGPASVPATDRPGSSRPREPASCRRFTHFALAHAAAIATCAAAATGPLAVAVARFAASGRIADRFTPVGIAATRSAPGAGIEQSPDPSQGMEAEVALAAIAAASRTRRKSRPHAMCCIRSRHCRRSAGGTGDEPARTSSRRRRHTGRRFRSRILARNRRFAKIRSTRTTTTEFHSPGP